MEVPGLIVHSPHFASNASAGVDWGKWAGFLSDETLDVDARWPARGEVAELASVQFQFGRRAPPAAVPTFSQVLASAARVVSDNPADVWYPASVSELPFEAARYALLNSPEAGAGLPFSLYGAKKEDWVADYARWEFLTAEATRLLVAFGSLTVAQVLAMEPHEVFEWFHPVRVFVKNELHPGEKAAASRWRLIFSVNVLWVLIEALLRLGEVKAIMTGWRVGSSKSGLGLDDAGAASLSETFRRFSRPVHLDISGMDFSQRGPFQFGAMLLTSALRGANSWWLHRAAIVEAFLARPFFCLSPPAPGALCRVFFSYDIGFTLSGRYCTTKLNTDSLLIVTDMAAKPAQQAGQGDDEVLDTAEDVDAVSRNINDLGYRCKGVFDDRTFVEFCSHRFHMNGGVENVNFPKAFANFVAKGPTSDTFNVFIRDNMHYRYIREFALFGVECGMELYEETRERLVELRSSRWGPEENESKIKWVPHSMKNGTRNSKSSRLHVSDDKRLRADLKAAAKSSGVVRARKGASSSGRPRASPSGGATNSSYASAVINPAMSVPPQLPDDNVSPSVTFKTEHQFGFTNNSAGNLYACFAPTLYNGALRVGINTATDSLTLMRTGSPDLPIANPGSDVVPIINPKAWPLLSASMTDIRPVSMSIVVTPINAALDATGRVYTGKSGRGAWPAQIDDPASAGFSTGAGSTMSNQLGTQGNGPATFSDVQDMADCVYGPLDRFELVWNIQDGQSTNYLPVPPLANGQSSSDPFIISPVAPPAGDNMQAANANWLITPSSNDDVIDEVNTYVIPVDLAYTIENPDTSTAAVYKIVRQPLHNYVFVVLRGCTASVTTHNFFVTINWEALPIKGPTSLFTPKVSRSDPVAFARTCNGIATLPSSKSINDPKAEQNTSFQKVAASIGTAAKTVSTVAGSLAPLLAAVL